MDQVGPLPFFAGVAKVGAFLRLILRGGVAGDAGLPGKQKAAKCGIPPGLQQQRGGLVVAELDNASLVVVTRSRGGVQLVQGGQGGLGQGGIFRLGSGCHQFAITFRAGVADGGQQLGVLGSATDDVAHYPTKVIIGQRRLLELQRDPISDDLGRAFLSTGGITQYLWPAKMAWRVNELPHRRCETFLVSAVLLPFADDGQLRVERFVAGDAAKRVEGVGANLCIAIAIECRLAERFDGNGARGRRGNERQRLVDLGVDAQRGRVDSVEFHLGDQLRFVFGIQLVKAGLDCRADAGRGLPFNRLKVGATVVRTGRPPLLPVPTLVDVIKPTEGGENFRIQRRIF